MKSMVFRLTKFHAETLAAAAFAVTLCAFSFHGYAQSAPFAGMAGSWSGGGRIDLQNGTSERIRCRATYSIGGGGSILQQELRCASDSYKFEVSSNVQSAGGAVSGTWSETTRNVSGSVSGSVSGGRIQARVDGGAFSAGLAVHTSGNQQTVTIVPVGTDVKGVAVTLTRGRG